jgi:hypothetical protein
MASEMVHFETGKRPSSEVSLPIVLIGGLVMTALFMAILAPLPEATFVRRLFIGAEGWYQCFIFYVFSLMIMTLILKIIVIRKQQAILDEDPLPENIDLEDTEQIQELQRRVRDHAGFEKSFLLYRIYRILEVWRATRDFDRTLQFAREESELDAAGSEVSFRANRMYMWSLPVLGFLGTVYGVSVAVSGFKTFLTGTVTAEAITREVGGITSGLAVAFFSTLVGLVTAFLGAFPTLFVERREGKLFEEIDGYVEDRIIARLPSPERGEKFPVQEIVDALKSSMSEIAANMKFPVEDLAKAIDAGFRRLPNPDKYEEVFTRAITKAGDIINQKYEEFQTNYERRVAELGSQLGGKLENVASNFNSGSQRLMDEFRKAQERNLETYAKNEQKLTERFDELNDRITNLGKEMLDTFSEAHEKYVDAVQELDRREIQRWEKMVADFNQLSVRLAEQFRQAVASLDSASARYSDSIRTACDALVEQLENITKLGNEIDKVLRTTQSMEATLRQVGGSDEFRQTLANLRSHLSMSDELLKQLSRPRKVIFQEARADEGM